MEDRKQYYRVYDVLEDKNVAENVTSTEIVIMLDLSSLGDVSRACREQRMLSGRYRIFKENIVEDKTYTNMVTQKWRKEWDELTKFIKSRVEWVPYGTEGARKVIIRAKNKENEQ